MKATTLATPLPLDRPRWLDFIEMTKPRIAMMVLFTVGIGAMLANVAVVDWMVLVHVLAGTALVASGATVLNQWMERHSDALMRRTENRPLPSGRMTPTEALVFGTGLGVVGLLYLGFACPQPMPAYIAGATFLSYVFVYTPMKRWSTLNTLVGAVPGALPPVIGWTAVTGRLDLEAGVLFLVVFLWQIPHFLAIAWMYREDYGRAGMKMLPVLDDDGSTTARQMVVYTLALIPVTLLPVMLRHAGWLYGGSAMLLGFWFLRATLGFARERNHTEARRVLWASLLYLPLLLLCLLVESLLRQAVRGPS